MFWHQVTTPSAHKTADHKTKGQNLAMVVEPANFLHQMSPHVEETPPAPTATLGLHQVIHVDQLHHGETLGIPQMDPETGMLQFSWKKDDDIDSHGKPQFCLPSMDKTVGFQDCETGFDDDIGLRVSA